MLFIGSACVEGERHWPVLEAYVRRGCPRTRAGCGHVFFFSAEVIMRPTGVAILVPLFVASLAFCQGGKPRKVFISVDMEGITGVVDWEDVSRSGKDYEYFRTIMTKEVNAAIEGALDAGVSDIVVRDAHGSARNLLPDLLNRNARLLRDWTGGFVSMMAGLDETFDAVLFVGYHAKAGTPNAILEHTSSNTNIVDLSINGISLPEAGLNALVAGHYNVPVVFASGDKALCDQVTALFGDVETVAVKEGIGYAALSLHPEVSQERIRAGVKRALLAMGRFTPYRLNSPYTLVVKYKNEEMVHEKSFYPGVRRTGDWELSYTADYLMDVIKAYYWTH